jgi:molybdopterin-guanine dinucleotide biosynthesis protein A
MGTDKALLRLRGKPLIQETAEALRARFPEAFIVADAAGAGVYAGAGLPVVADRVRGAGPLAGIAAALAAASRDRVFVVACDMPDLDFALVARLLDAAADADCAVPRVGEGLYEPLYAVYRRSALPAAEAALAEGRFGVHGLFSRLSVRWVDHPAGLRNLNTPEDVSRYRSGS